MSRFRRRLSNDPCPIRGPAELANYALPGLPWTPRTPGYPASSCCRLLSLFLSGTLPHCPAEPPKKKYFAGVDVKTVLTPSRRMLLAPLLVCVCLVGVRFWHECVRPWSVCCRSCCARDTAQSDAYFKGVAPAPDACTCRFSPLMATTRATTTSGMSPGTSTSRPNPTERGSSATTVSPAPFSLQQRGGQAPVYRALTPRAGLGVYAGGHYMRNPDGCMPRNDGMPGHCAEKSKGPEKAHITLPVPSLSTTDSPLSLSSLPLTLRLSKTD